jgi:hypothetical protein
MNNNNKQIVSIIFLKQMLIDITIITGTGGIFDTLYTYV